MEITEVKIIPVRKGALRGFVDCDALIAGVQEKDPHGVVLKDIYKTGAAKKVPDNRPPA
jgi:hypothetical protein